jgi:hypothetical protein
VESVEREAEKGCIYKFNLGYLAVTYNLLLRCIAMQKGVWTNLLAIFWHTVDCSAAIGSFILISWLVRKALGPGLPEIKRRIGHYEIRPAYNQGEVLRTSPEVS